MQTNRGPNTLGYQIASIVYLAIVIVGAWLLGFFDPHGKPISPSDWGNVLAGVFSPLAFLWLLYASLSQRAELELQREELRVNNETQDRQREEMAKQVSAMQAQANVLEAQANANHDPIFVLDHADVSDYGENRESMTRFVIKNHGASVLNIKCNGSFLMSATFSGDSRRQVVPLWKHDNTFSLIYKDFSLDDDAQIISISYQRMDSIRKANVYLLRDKATRMELIETMSDGIPLTSAF